MPTNTPRDFFLHLSAFAVLYFVAIAALTLLFTLIDYRFPDEIQGYFGDPYSGPVRFAIASLIILSPIFVSVMRLIQRETRMNPERAKLPVRKWLTYITLFIAGITVVGDLVFLLNEFLGGSLPTAFALKAVTLLIVAGAGFGYFLADLRGYWTTHAAHSNYAAGGIIFATIVSIILGFYVMGSPSTQRMLRMDNERTNDLSAIQFQILTYWRNNQKLPDTLADLNDPLAYFELPTDPETGASYGYEMGEGLAFKLCATFDLESPREMRGEYYPESMGIKGSGNWKHETGEHCFDRAIDPELYKPVAVPIQ